MKAILQVGDMKIFGKAKLHGLNINFQGSHIMQKRRTKMHPTDLVIKRLDKGVEPKLELHEDGVIFTENLLSYGLSIAISGQFFIDANFKLKNAP